MNDIATLSTDLRHPSALILEALNGRGWKAADLARRMRGTFSTNLFTVNIYLSVAELRPDSATLRLGGAAAAIAEALGWPSQSLSDAEAAWVAQRMGPSRPVAAAALPSADPAVPEEKADTVPAVAALQGEILTRLSTIDSNYEKLRKNFDKLRLSLLKEESSAQPASKIAAKPAKIVPPPILSETSKTLFRESDFYRAEHARVAEIDGVKSKLASGEMLSVREKELVGKRYVPKLARIPTRPILPPASVAFVTIANDNFLPGLEGLLLSLLAVYPDLQSDFIIMHDGTLSEFVKRRLQRHYAKVRFEIPNMDWFEDVPARSNNHKRIGKLGYMNIQALLITDYERVIIFDSDMLIWGDISELWKGDEIIVAYDCGDREYAAWSERTGDYIINSGMISLPKSALGRKAYREIKKITISSNEPACDLLDRFADQKVWNLYLSGKPKRIAPTNYNCNVKYIVNFMNGLATGLGIVHFAGPKPWVNQAYLNQKYLPTQPATPPRNAPVRFDKLWQDKYREILMNRRLDEYREYSVERRATPVRSAADLLATKRTCFMIGNGPSIAKTDLSIIARYEKFCFNWFVHHPAFDEIAPEHLVLGSHMFFGGWWTQQPSFPDGFLDALKSKRHRPVLWSSFYFKDIFDEVGLSNEYEINYLLFEKPFKRFVDKAGYYDPDPDGFLNDARTGVLSLGVPAACLMGFENIGLVGCDSSYNKSSTGSNYFYSDALHTSLQTNESSLTSTWTDEGRGQFVYKLVSEGLRDRGMGFFDCTVDGELTTVAKRKLAEFRIG